METTWIVTADTGRARIFEEADPSQPLREVEDLVNAPGRMSATEMYTDRLGPTAAGKSKHDTGAPAPNKQYEPPTTPEEQAAESFARELSHLLVKGYNERQFQKLTIIAEPKFLGFLRAALDPKLKPLIRQEINKDFAHSNAHQLREQLNAHKAEK
jgi:protein required for attachment to host cells